MRVILYGLHGHIIWTSWSYYMDFMVILYGLHEQTNISIIFESPFYLPLWATSLTHLTVLLQNNRSNDFTANGKMKDHVHIQETMRQQIIQQQKKTNEHTSEDK